jgi:hypothetical protein
MTGQALSYRMVSTMTLWLMYILWTPISVRLTKGKIFAANSSSVKNKIFGQIFFNAIQLPN